MKESTVDKIEIGKNVRAARERKNFIRDDLAELCGVSRSTIENIENGNRLPSVSVFVELCNKLQVPPGYILGRNIKPVEKKTYSKEDLLMRLEECTENQVNIMMDIMETTRRYMD